MKKCLVITGGGYPQRSIIETRIKPDLVIAADSGLEAALDLGYSCDYVVGDFDSVRPRLLDSLSEDKIIRYPQDKDFTDTELAIQLARNENSGFIAVAGGGGGRLDHLMGILALFERSGSPDMWISDNSIVILIKKIYTVKGALNKTLSFFPVGPDPCTMRSEGLKWPLDSLVWNKGDCGISNIAACDEVTVRMKTGRLVCVQNFQPEP